MLLLLDRYVALWVAFCCVGCLLDNGCVRGYGLLLLS